MRLTLRTLLAYLDDILEPADARALGEKIQESPLATSLVDKIQDVVRRRRIGAPTVSGPGSTPDSNVVAEYLDNTLPPEAISELERICLESDAHLAEVAACHQILTLVLGKPVEVPPRLREQMYSLGAVAPAEDTPVPAAGVRPKVAGVGAADVSRDVEPRTAERDLLARRPEPVQRTPVWKRSLPYVFGAVIVIGWAYMIVTDYFPQTGEEAHATNLPDAEPVLERKPGGEAADGRSAAPGTLESGAADEPIVVELAQDDPADASGDLPDPGAVATPPGQEELAAIDAPEVLPDVPVNPVEDVSPEPESEDPVVPADDADAVARAVGDVVPVEPVPPVAAALPQVSPYQVQYANADGILVYRDAGSDRWAVTPRRALIYPEEEIASPEPFDARLTVSDEIDLGELVLRGGTRVRFLPATPEARIGVEIARGRLLVQRPADAPEDGVLRMRLKVRDDEWLCALGGVGSLLGVEVVPLQPTGIGDLTGRSSCRGTLVLITGHARLEHVTSERVVNLTPEQGMLTFSGQPEAGLAQPESLSSIPDWMRTEETASTVARQLSIKFEKEFIPEQPVAASIRPVVKDKQPRVSELATRTLSLTSNVPGLLDALSAPHQESRVAAIEGLRIWLPADQQHGEQLKAELDNRFRDETASAIGRLLWGYSEQDARDQAASRDLVNWLTHDEIAVRELAFYHVQRLTNRTYGYRPDRRADEREATAKHWRDRLQKTGALLSE